MTTYSSGITAILARMETNPAEFFGDGGKWRFIFKETFREVLTEPEKGALHEKLKEVRRQEFDHMVMRTILDDQMQGAFGASMSENRLTATQSQLINQSAEKYQNKSALQNNSGGLLGSFK